MYVLGLQPEKPIDLVLNYIEGMKDKLKQIDLDIEYLQKDLIRSLNEKIEIEEKISKWIKVADRFKFKKKDK